ncbi:MAG: hypothetical protein QF909_07935 [SAR202 cluster bacterium]|nr:hypothetical protein [SAR202 cluster bacterium]
MIEGDFFDAELGHGYDVALGLLRPGGMIIVQDYLRTGRSPDQVRIDKLENLYVKVVFDPRAADREGEEVAGWLRESGFEDTRLIPLPTQLALITATKPL